MRGPTKPPGKGTRRRGWGEERCELDGTGQVMRGQRDRQGAPRERRTLGQNHPERPLHSGRHSQRHCDLHNTWRASPRPPEKHRHPRRCSSPHRHTDTYRQMAAAEQETRRHQPMLPFTCTEPETQVRTCRLSGAHRRTQWAQRETNTHTYKHGPQTDRRTRGSHTRVHRDRGTSLKPAGRDRHTQTLPPRQMETHPPTRGEPSGGPRGRQKGECEEEEKHMRPRATPSPPGRGPCSVPGARPQKRLCP